MAGVAFCVALGFGVVAPAIPLFATQFGVNATAAGAVVSVFALMRLVSALAAGRLVDAVGERRALMLGIAVVAVSSLLAGLSQSYPQLVLLRGVGGIGSAVFGVAAMSLVLRVASQRTRGRAVSIYRGGFLLGGIAGPAVGGAVLGISLRAPFFLYAGTLGLAGIVAMVFVSHPTTKSGRIEDTDADSDAEVDVAVDDISATLDLDGAALAEVTTETESGDGIQPERGVRELLHTREYQAALVTNLAVGLAILGLRSTVVPLLFVDSLGVEPGWVGAAFVASALVQTALMFPAGRLADTAGRRPAIILGSAVSVTGLLMLAFGHSLPFALAAMGVFGAGSAFLGTAPAALVGDVAGPRSGRVVAVFNMASDLGAVTGPVLAGWLVDQGSYTAAFAMGAVVVGTAGVLGLRLPKNAGHAPVVAPDQA